MRFVFRLSQAYFFLFDFLSKSDLTMDHFSVAKYFSSARSKNIFFRFFSSGRFALCLLHPDFIRHRKPADKLEPSVKSTPSLGMRFLLLDRLSTLDHYLVSKDFGKSFHLIQIIGLIPFWLIFRWLNVVLQTNQVHFMRQTIGLSLSNTNVLPGILLVLLTASEYPFHVRIQTFSIQNHR